MTFLVFIALLVVVAELVGFVAIVVLWWSLTFREDSSRIAKWWWKQN
jgi:hypothetical protein